MTYRWLLTAIVVAATLTAGCTFTTRTGSSPSRSATTSSTYTTDTATSSALTSTSSETIPTAPSSTLESSQCADVTGANVDLLAASDKDAARKAADTLENYNPPADVKEAIEHFVSVGGAHFDDPDYARYNMVLDNWVKGVCPT